MCMCQVFVWMLWKSRTLITNPFINNLQQYCLEPALASTPPDFQTILSSSAILDIIPYVINAPTHVTPHAPHVAPTYTVQVMCSSVMFTPAFSPAFSTWPCPGDGNSICLTGTVNTGNMPWHFPWTTCFTWMYTSRRLALPSFFLAWLVALLTSGKFQRSWLLPFDVRNCYSARHNVNNGERHEKKWCVWTSSSSLCCKEAPLRLRLTNIITIYCGLFSLRAILCKGSRYPVTLPRPMLSILQYHVPLCDVSTDKGNLEVSRPQLQHYLTSILQWLGA